MKRDEIDSPFLQIHCFGALRVQSGARVVERFRTQKTAALFALLAICGQRSRETLCELLWPDAPPEAARNSLSAALSSLRKELGDDAVCADRFYVSLAPNSFQTDVAQFDAAWKNIEYSKCVELYRGHLLPGFYDEPFPALSREYEEKARVAFDARLAQLGSEGKANETLSLVRVAIVLFGDSDAFFVTMMRAHHGLGDIDAALRAYENLQKWARKNGEVVSETARAHAKELRRAREQKLGERPTIAPLLAPPTILDLAPIDSDNSAKNEKATPSSPDNAPIVSSLPTQWTPFFGRETERERLLDWVRADHKLLTLTGVGGGGKTRLAIEIARALEPERRVYFVALAPLLDADLLHSTVRDALNVVASPDVPPLQQIARALGDSPCLLVLDNFEQLVESGAAGLQRLREALPHATFLVTSRALLRLPGEREFAVAPLPTPLEDSAADELRHCASVALFCDRATLQIGDSNAPAIGALCRRLDGIPLALELAAARARVLAPQQILQRLEKQSDFLQSRELGTAPRHKTLRATIEWSVDLLDECLRDFFVRLSVFRGGFTLDAAEHIAAPGLCDDWETLDFLEQLRANSLIVVSTRTSSTRYRLLETLREWGAAQLDEWAQHALQMRHLEFFTQKAKDISDPISLSQRAVELESDQANLRAALGFALEHDTEHCTAFSARLAVALSCFWEARSLNAEGREWCERVLAVDCEMDEVLRADMAQSAGVMCWCCGEYAAARAHLEDSLVRFRALGDERGEAAALDYRAKVAGVTGGFEEELVEGRAVIALARRQNDVARLMSSLITTSWGALNTGRQDEALEYLDEGIALATRFHEHRVLATCQGTRMFSLLLSGRVEETVQARDKALQPLDERAGLWAQTFLSGCAGIISLALGDVKCAQKVLPDVAENFYMISTNWEVACLLLTCGQLALALGDPERAALLFGASQGVREERGHVMLNCLRPGYETALSGLHEALPETTRLELWERGRTMPLESAVQLAVQLRHVAR